MKNQTRLRLALTTVLLSGTLAVSAGAFSQEARESIATARKASDSRLEKALSAIRAESIKADLTFIASDELAGRDTPSEGLRQAARYIRARLESLSFTPGGRDGDYFHYYKLVRSRLDRDNTYLALAGKEIDEKLSFGDGYYFWPNGVAEFSAEGGLTYAGHGAASDVVEVDLAGRWAFAWDSEIPPAEREANLRARGAVGILVASPLEDEDTHGDQRARGIARWASGNRMRVVTRNAETPFPHVYVKRAIAERIAVALDAEPAVGQDLGIQVTDRRSLGDDAEEFTLENVCGFWPGSDPELSQEVLIVSAHYDHVGTSNDEIYNGADDNGSGTCGLLAIAGALAEHGPLKRSVLLLWVSGEEKGLLGSEAWTLDPTLPAGFQAVANLNIDMIGRNAPDYLSITPTRQHPAYNGLTVMAEKAAPLEGFPKLESCDEYWERSDHRNFSVHLDIPVAFLFSNIHADYHQPTDTVEKIDFDKIARVSRVVVRMLAELQDLDMAELAPE